VKAGRIAVVVSGFPRRSETFVLNEILALEQRGMLSAIFATKPGEENDMQPGAGRILRRVEYLPRGDADRQVTEIAKRLRGGDVCGIHAWFAHLPAEIAARSAERLGVPFGFGAHARDVSKVAAGDLSDRARRAACVIACNRDVIRRLPDGDARLHLVPHGVDLDRFRPSPVADGGVLQILAIGRLVEKKGFRVLIEAVSQLSVPVHLRIVGDGPERARLRAAALESGANGHVELCEPKTHADLPAEYARADLVAVPSIEDAAGDRDGLPNVVLEAMACARPVVASRMGAIDTAVVDGRTGLLLPPGDVQALADALETLARRPDLRQALGASARRAVEGRFDLRRCTRRLERVLRTVYG
jgi:glycosyltransferase involved in cell wall biosynthesis